MLGLAIGPMGTFYVITFYLQQVRHYSPLLTGLSCLPFAAGIILGAGLAPKLLLTLAPRYVAAGGALLGAAGAFWFSRVGLDTAYWTGIAPAMLVVAPRLRTRCHRPHPGCVYRVDQDKAGIASALLNSAQQIGVARGPSRRRRHGHRDSGQHDTADARGRLQHGTARRHRNPARYSRARGFHAQ